MQVHAYLAMIIQHIYLDVYLLVFLVSIVDFQLSMLFIKNSMQFSFFLFFYNNRPYY